MELRWLVIEHDRDVRLRHVYRQVVSKEGGLAHGGSLRCRAPFAMDRPQGGAATAATRDNSARKVRQSVHDEWAGNCRQSIAERPRALRHGSAHDRSSPTALAGTTRVSSIRDLLTKGDSFARWERGCVVGAGAPCSHRRPPDGRASTAPPRAARWRITAGHGERDTDRMPGGAPSRCAPLPRGGGGSFSMLLLARTARWCPQVGSARVTRILADVTPCSGTSGLRSSHLEHELPVPPFG